MNDKDKFYKVDAYYSEKEMQALVYRAEAASLDAPRGFFNLPVSRLRFICNGVGSESAPKWLRNRTTHFFRSIQATAAIHDFMYYRSDGTFRGQCRADDTFLSNGNKEINLIYSWYNWRRYIAKAKLFIAYSALVFGGNHAWQKCFKER